MKVLVTGAFGFLGGRLSEGLRARAHQVVLSGLDTPADAAAWASGFEVRHADLVQASSLDALTEGIDAVVHLAALNEHQAAKDPEGAARISSDATARLFAAAKQSGARAFVFASTFHVYGAAADVAIDEDTPTTPKAAYAEVHLQGELRCRALHSEACRAIALRFSNVYGTPVRLGVDRWTLAHNDFCATAARGGSIVLKSAGLQHRDFVWVDDVASAIDLTLRDSSRDAATYDVGGEDSRSIYALATLVRERAREVLGRDVTIERPEPTANDLEIPVRYSIARLKALGFVPHDRLREETDRMLRALAK